MSFYIKLLIISPDPGIQIVSMSEDINYHHACNYKCLFLTEWHGTDYKS